MTLPAVVGELVACPMCGGKAEAANYVIEAEVRCTGCGLKIKRTHPRHNDDGLPQAIDAWNRRATLSALTAEAGKGEVDGLARAQELAELINANAANSVTGFGTRDNRRQIFNWSQEIANLLLECRQ
jgi:hypothetical protein